MILDTHAHLQFPEFKDDLSDVLARAYANGVTKIINVGCTLDACERGLEIINEHDGKGVELFATLGLHPYDAEFLSDDVLGKWAEEIKKYNSGEKKKIVAVGEVGLDYFKAKVEKSVQIDAFKRQIEFALRMDLPLIVHNREADDDSLQSLKELGAKKVVFHCFGSNLDFAKVVWGEGYLTSFTGIITYPNASNLREVVEACPDDKWMVETDCPYLAPQSRRGERNEPSYVKEVLEKVAEIKGINSEECLKTQSDNANLFFQF